MRPLLDKKYILLNLILFVTIFLSWKFYSIDYQQTNTFFIHQFPEIIQHWTSQDLPIEKADRSVLENANTALYRVYRSNDGKRVYLYIVYSKTNPKATNPPEVCYKDAGISILDKGKKAIIINAFPYPFEVNWLLSTNEQSQQISYYWYKVGSVYTSSYWKQQGLVALNNLSGGGKGSALIRISVDITNGQREAVKRINSFIALIMPELSQNLP